LIFDKNSVLIGIIHFLSCCILPFNIFITKVEAQNESSKKLTNANYKGLGLAVGSKLSFHQESAIVKHEKFFL
jgi:hypothetical protein